MAVAGWYADPYGAQGQLRYWDGAQWTANVMPRPSSAPVQGGAAPSGPIAAQAQAGQVAPMQQPRTIHESIPLGANMTAAPTAGAYGYQGQPMDQQYAAQGQPAQAGQAQANPYGAAQGQAYGQVANAYEAAAQGYAQAANAYDAAAQGYAAAGGQYDPNAQAYGQYDPNAQAYGQMGASPYYQGYDAYGQAAQAQPQQAPEGSNRTLRLLAVIFYILTIVGVAVATTAVALGFAGVLDMGYGYNSSFNLFTGKTPLVFIVAVPLAWLIPMFIHTIGILKGKKRNSVLFGILTILLCGVLPAAISVVVMMGGGFPDNLAPVAVLPGIGILAGLFLLIAKKDPKPAAM